MTKKESFLLLCIQTSEPTRSKWTQAFVQLICSLSNKNQNFELLHVLFVCFGDFFREQIAGCLQQLIVQTHPKHFTEQAGEIEFISGLLLPLNSSISWWCLECGQCISRDVHFTCKNQYIHYIIIYVYNMYTCFFKMSIFVSGDMHKLNLDDISLFSQEPPVIPMSSIIPASQMKNPGMNRKKNRIARLGFFVDTVSVISLFFSSWSLNMTPVWLGIRKGRGVEQTLILLISRVVRVLSISTALPIFFPGWIVVHIFYQLDL